MKTKTIHILLGLVLLSTPAKANPLGPIADIVPGLGDILDFAKRNEKWLNTITDISNLQSRFGDQQAWKDALMTRAGQWLNKNANWTKTDFGKFVYGMMDEWDTVRGELNKLNAQWIVNQMIPLEMQDPYNLVNPLAYVTKVQKEGEIKTNETARLDNVKTDQQTGSILASAQETLNKYNQTVAETVLNKDTGVTSKFGELIANSTSTREAMQITATAIVEQINQQALSTSAIMTQLSRQIEQQTITNNQLTSMVDSIIRDRTEKLEQQKALIEKQKIDAQREAKALTQDVFDYNQAVLNALDTPCAGTKNLFQEVC